MKSRSTVLIVAILIFATEILLSTQVGPFNAASIIISFGLLGFMSIWGIIALAFSNRTAREISLLSLIFSPLLLAFSAWISGISGLFASRFIVSALGILVSIYAIWLRSRTSGVDTHSSLDTRRPVLIASVIGSLILIPSALVAASTQQISPDTVLNLYPDVPWQTAMVSEALVRAPQEFPYLSGNRLAYPWLFHGFLGDLGSLTDLSAGTLYTQIWPILYALLLPVSASYLAWKITKNFWVTVLFPVVLSLFVGPVLPFAESMRFPVSYSISPTYEFGLITLFALIALISLPKPSSKSAKIFYYLLIFLSVFVASGAKGGNGLIIVAIVGTLVFREWFFKKKFLQPSIQAAIAAIAAVLAYTLTISGSSGNLSISPLSFLPNLTSLSSPVMFLVTTFLWLSASVFVIYRQNTRQNQVFWPIIFGSVSGVLLTAFLGHPGFSQLYFYWTVVPLIALVGIWAISILLMQFGVIFLLPLFTAWVVGQILDSQVSYFFDATDYAKFKWPIVWIILLITLVLIPHRHKNQKTSRTRLWNLVVAAIVASLAAQPFGMTRNIYSGPLASPGVEIFPDQYSTFIFLKENTSSSARVMTNRHCLSPSGNSFDCDSRYVALTAFSERQTYIEGHYNLADSKVHEMLTVNDAFYESPTSESLKHLWGEGVRYLYVDKTVGKFADFSNFATQLADTEHTQLWKLSQP